MDNIWLISLLDGELLPANVSVHGAGDNDAALYALGGYAYETEDTWADGVLSVEVFSAHTQGAVLRRKLTLSEVQWRQLAAGVLVFTAPDPMALTGFQAMLERGEAEEPLSIGVKSGNYYAKSKYYC